VYECVCVVVCVGLWWFGLVTLEEGTLSSIYQ